jgi:hypothetical protein
LDCWRRGLINFKRKPLGKEPLGTVIEAEAKLKNGFGCEDAD